MFELFIMKCFHVWQVLNSFLKPEGGIHTWMRLLKQNLNMVVPIQVPRSSTRVTNFFWGVSTGEDTKCPGLVLERVLRGRLVLERVECMFLFHPPVT